MHPGFTVWAIGSQRIPDVDHQEEAPPGGYPLLSDHAGNLCHPLLDQVIRLLGSQVCNAIARSSKRGNEGFIFLNYLYESFNYIWII